MTTLELQMTETKEPKKKETTPTIMWGKDRTSLALLPPSGQQLFRPKPQSKLPAAPKLPPAQSYSYERMDRKLGLLAQNLATGKRVTIELPIGIPRYITAATLKLLLKGRRSDTLLQSEQGDWIVCASSQRIDLHDTTVQFRVGPIAVFS